MDLYQENILDYYRNPRNFGELANADVVQAERNSTCGDELTFYLKFDGDTLQQIQFTGKGCAISMASASMLCEDIEGMTRDTVQQLSKEDVLDLLAIELGPTRLKCALLSLQGIHNAVK